MNISEVSQHLVAKISPIYPISKDSYQHNGSHTEQGNQENQYQSNKSNSPENNSSEGRLNILV